jgi:capsular polysaccharide transport system permease protein
VYIAPPAPPARAKRRHWGLLFSFFLFVVGPIAVAGWYLWERAAPRYVSYAGFSVRTEEAGSATDFLGNISALSGSSSSDTDILYNFIRSQEMVRIVDETLDIRALWSKADPDVDPIFAYHAPGNIEDLTAYWGRMVKVYNDDGSGLIDMAVQAFSPQDATRIAEVIYDESSKMINRLSSIARDDAIAYAREELTTAEENLRKARLEITRFRNVNQIVDPSVSIQGQAGLLASLEAQLAETLIDLDILKDTARANDPRIVALERRFDAINARIEEERKRVGVNDDGDGFADLVDQYESLSIDLKFTEETYTVARAAFASALAEARRQNRYLAAHVRPTSAESAEHPERYSILALVALFAFLAWVLCVLSSYAIKDRR